MSSAAATERTLIARRRVVPDIGPDRFDENRQFYADVLGFKGVIRTGRARRALTDVRRMPHVPQHQDAP